jgi:quercetin dioxygenase-like cupin family protein
MISPIIQSCGKTARWFAAGSLVSMAVAVLTLGLVPVVSADEEPISIRLLTDRHTFTDDVGVQITLTPEGRSETLIELDDASRLVMAEVTIQPDTWFPWHTHPGSSLSAITEGELIYIYADDCVERSYPAGTAIVDPGFDNVHTAYNPSEDEKTVLIATFLGAPDEGMLTLPIGEEQAAELDERCGIER